MSNITLNSGAGGATLGTDQVAGTPNVDYQIVKIGYSVAGSAPTQVSASNQLPVLATQTGTWTVTTTPPSNASTNVSQINGVTPLMGNGVTGTGSLRVTVASDNTAFSVNAVQSGSWSLAANQSVNTAQINGVAPLMGNGVTGTGSQRVTIASDNTAFSVNAIQSGSWSLAANQSVNVAQMNGVAVTMGNGVAGTGVQRVAIASDNTAFTVNAAQSGTWTVQPGNTANSTPWLVTDTPATSGGLSFSSFVGAASNNKTQVKGSAGQLYMVSVQNLAATPVYLKVFNNTSAGVTAGTTNCDFQFMIPGNTAGAGLVLNIDKGIAMGTGITVMLTAAIATNDNTSVSANQQVVTIGYK